MAGVSVRTLRYYDQIGLLPVGREAQNGYRQYGPEQIERLQQILLYREMGMPLEQIRRCLCAPDYDAQAALSEHLADLRARQERLTALVANVEKTLAAAKGEITMTDSERFEGLKRDLVDKNEKNYGQEARKLYGDEAVEASNAKLMGLSQADYDKVQALSASLEALLGQAMQQGDPAGPLAQEACDVHRQWLCYFWKQYSKQAHLGLGEMYVSDPRFTAYYDRIAPGCAVFLRDALMIYCQ